MACVRIRHGVAHHADGKLTYVDTADAAPDHRRASADETTGFAPR
jgi:hypothetical protein